MVEVVGNVVVGVVEVVVKIVVVDVVVSVRFLQSLPSKLHSGMKLSKSHSPSLMYCGIGQPTCSQSPPS